MTDLVDQNTRSKMMKNIKSSDTQPEIIRRKALYNQGILYRMYNSPMEHVFRSLKSEWIPSTGYHSINEAKREIGYYPMNYYNRERPHQFNNGLPPAKAEELAKKVAGLCWPLQLAHLFGFVLYKLMFLNVI